jgi:arginine N-succinyltransferase
VTFLLRPARVDDLERIFALAELLDSPNLPADRGLLEGRLERSERSFAEGGRPSGEREYQLALENASGRVVGTCAVLSKHGTPDMPHTYLRVAREERYSETTGARAHVTLRLGVCRDGPTEIGALVLEPETRGQPGWPGKLLSWGRFALIARHRDRFEGELLAEMRAALDPGGRSAFWEAFGGRFTGMSYEEADRRSAVDKEFILDLFPDSVFYATLLAPSVVERLGAVHEESCAAVRLLERAGFAWNGQIDPFDAGPFYAAATDSVVPIRDGVWRRVGEKMPPPGAPPCMIAAGIGAGFRCVAARASDDGDAVAVEPQAIERLGARAGDEVSIHPLGVSEPKRESNG